MVITVATEGHSFREGQAADKETNEAVRCRDMTPYLQFDRSQWAALRDSVPMTLTEDEIAQLKGINEDLSLEE
ncbi:hypothetical protein MJM28_29360, partial [Salmonella enterica subsp. enterica serovar Montevideo]|nr:hypothetical protein [Salmonella enterica subsp. enterica serovar Montevideo]